MTHETKISPVAASGPGALAGFEVRCDSCGFVARSSSEVIARDDARDHTRYMTGQRGPRWLGLAKELAR